jgi:adenosylcobinamide kinase/adenosylcobinamide-phosphate guanylyltransferase
LYVATATADDEEMVARIAHHRAQRPASWRTVEAPTAVAARTSAALRELTADEEGIGTTERQQPEPTVLVEDLTLLLSNVFEVDAATAERRATEEVDSLLQLPAHVVLVSNEVGLGIVPAYPLGRSFRDAMGRLNQHAAAECKEVVFLIAGLPLYLKGVATIELD